MKSAIVFDFDETIRHMSYNPNCKDNYAIELRQGIDELIQTMEQAKAENPDLDIVIYTSAESNICTQRTLDLDPRLAALVDKTIHGCGVYYPGAAMDNEYGGKLKIDPEKYPAEAAVNGPVLKAVTALGYDKVIFFEDNVNHIQAVGDTYDEYQNQGITPTVDTTVVQVERYTGGITSRDLQLNAHLVLTSEDPDIQREAMEHLEAAKKDSGCHIMSECIKDFVHKEYVPGLQIECIAREERFLKDKFGSHVSVSSYEVERETLDKSDAYKEAFRAAFRDRDSIDSRITDILNQDNADKISAVIDTVKEIQAEASQNIQKDSIRKAVVFDLDETLRRMTYHYDGPAKDTYTIELRQGINELIETLQSAKEKNPNLDVVIYTSAASDALTQTTLDLDPRLSALVDRTIHGCGVCYEGSFINDEFGGRLKIDREQYPVEASANSPALKAVTALGYDQVLFIDDSANYINEINKVYAKYSSMGITPEVDTTALQVTMYRGGVDNEDFIVQAHVAATADSPEIREEAKRVIASLKEDGGCHTMSEAIDKFIEKEYAPGLEIVCLEGYEYNFNSNMNEYTKLSTYPEPYKEVEQSEAYQEAFFNAMDAIDDGSVAVHPEIQAVLNSNHADKISAMEEAVEAAEKAYEEEREHQEAAVKDDGGLEM